MEWSTAKSKENGDKDKFMKSKKNMAYSRMCCTEANHCSDQVQDNYSVMVHNHGKESPNRSISDHLARSTLTHNPYQMAASGIMFGSVELLDKDKSAIKPK